VSCTESIIRDHNFPWQIFCSSPNSAYHNGRLSTQSLICYGCLKLTKIFVFVPYVLCWAGIKLHKIQQTCRNAVEIGKLHSLAQFSILRMVPSDVELFAVCLFQSPRDGGQDLYTARFEPQVLAAMSRHVALFPPSRRDDSYPPQLNKLSPSSPAYNSSGPSLTRYRNKATSSKQNSPSSEKTTAQLTDDLKSNGNVTLELNAEGAVFGCSKRSMEKLHRRLAMRYVLNPVDFVPQNGVSTTLHPAQLPFSNETLASLTTFCFPGTGTTVLLLLAHLVQCITRQGSELSGVCLGTVRQLASCIHVQVIKCHVCFTLAILPLL